jgi:hypothetical protein
MNIRYRLLVGTAFVFLLFLIGLVWEQNGPSRIAALRYSVIYRLVGCDGKAEKFEDERLRFFYPNCGGTQVVEGESRSFPGMAEYAIKKGVDTYAVILKSDVPVAKWVQSGNKKKIASAGPAIDDLPVLWYSEESLDKSTIRREHLAGGAEAVTFQYSGFTPIRTRGKGFSMLTVDKHGFMYLVETSICGLDCSDSLTVRRSKLSSLFLPESRTIYTDKLSKTVFDQVVRTIEIK